MTYRDNEEALKARIQATESKLAQSAREQADLGRELESARQDLAALQRASSPQAPRVLLLVGATGAAVWALCVLATLPYLFGIVRTMFWFRLIDGLGDVAVGLGMMGLFLLTRQRLALAAAILLAIGLPEALLQQLGAQSGLGPAVVAWLRSLAATVVVGATVFDAPYIRPSLRTTTGLLFYISAGLGLLAFVAILLQRALAMDTGFYIKIMGALGIPNALVTLGKTVCLLMCFLELRSRGTRPAHQSPAV